MISNLSGNRIIVDPVSNPIDLISIINHSTVELEPPAVDGQEMPGPSSLKRARGESIGEATINTKKSKMVSAKTSSATGIRDMQKQFPQHYTLTMASKNYYRGKFILESPYLTTEKNSISRTQHTSTVYLCWRSLCQLATQMHQPEIRLQCWWVWPIKWKLLYDIAEIFRSIPVSIATADHMELQGRRRLLQWNFQQRDLTLCLWPLF